MGRIARIVASGTGCSRRAAEAVERDLIVAGLTVKEKQEVKTKKEKKPKTFDLEVNETMTSKLE